MSLNNEETNGKNTKNQDAADESNSEPNASTEEQNDQTSERSEFKGRIIPDTTVSVMCKKQGINDPRFESEKKYKEFNALIFNFNGGSNVWMSHFHNDNTWITQLWKQDELETKIINRSEKRTKTPIDKFEPRTSRRLVTEMIKMGAVRKPRDGLKLLETIVENLDDCEIDWLYDKAFMSLNEKIPWFFFIEGRRKIFNAEAIANSVIFTYRKNLSSNILTIEDEKPDHALYAYENGIYCQAANDIKILIRGILAQYSSVHYVNECLEAIRTKTLITRDLFNKPNGDLNLNNGIFNYHTQEFIPHNINSLFTYSIDIDYDHEATCPNIMKYLEWAQPDEKARFTILEEMAYCFVNGYPIQRLFFWFGPGGNGKGTMLNVLVSLIGKNNVSHADLEALEKDKNYSQALLFGKKLNACGDIPAKKTSFNFINNITGGDGVTVRGIYGKPFTLYNEAKVFFSMNLFPEITNVSDGPMRRLMLTTWYSTKGEDGEPFSNEFMESLQSPEELSGLFNEVVKLIPDLLKRGDFKYAPDADQTRKDINLLRGSDVIKFLLEKTTKDLDSTTTVESLYIMYKNWAKVADIEPKPLKMFLMSVRLMGYGESTNNNIDVIDGIKFKG